MAVTQETLLQFCQNLGKLFYAIAAADKAVEDPEIEKLKVLVHEKWMPREDFKNTAYQNAALEIISTFNWLHLDGEYNAETCYREFIRFKNKHAALFTPDIKQLILETAAAIAASFSHTNKSELIMLAKLSLAFKKT